MCGTELISCQCGSLTSANASVVAIDRKANSVRIVLGIEPLNRCIFIPSLVVISTCLVVVGYLIARTSVIE